MQDKIKKLIDRAVSAPSGDNCQPWSLVLDGDDLQIFNQRKKDTSLYNYQQRASLIAHGALLENIAILAPSYGLATEIKYHTDSTTTDMIANVHFSPAKTYHEPLAEWVDIRCTNRKRYTKIPITKRQADELSQAISLIPGVQIHIKHDPETITLLAKTLATNDQLVFENQHLHSFLFDHIRWNDEEAISTADGMDIKTLELAKMDTLAFRIFKNWQIVGFFNKVGLSRIVAANGEKLIKSSAGIIALTVDKLTEETFITIGRAMQRVWLEATRLGLSVQVMAGLVLLIQRLNAGEVSGLSIPQQRRINQAAINLNHLFALNDRPLVMLFRIGTSAPPSARSLRIRQPLKTP